MIDHGSMILALKDYAVKRWKKWFSITYAKKAAFFATVYCSQEEFSFINFFPSILTRPGPKKYSECGSYPVIGGVKYVFDPPYFDRGLS